MVRLLDVPVAENLLQRAYNEHLFGVGSLDHVNRPRRRRRPSVSSGIATAARPGDERLRSGETVTCTTTTTTTTASGIFRAGVRSVTVREIVVASPRQQRTSSITNCQVYRVLFVNFQVPTGWQDNGRHKITKILDRSSGPYSQMALRSSRGDRRFYRTARTCPSTAITHLWLSNTFRLRTVPTLTDACYPGGSGTL